MLNNCKDIITSCSITENVLSDLLNISERQAFNIVRGNQKSLEKYLIISYITGTKLNDIWELSEEEKIYIRKKMILINELKKG